MLPGLCLITHTCSLLSVILYLIKYNFLVLIKIICKEKWLDSGSLKKWPCDSKKRELINDESSWTSWQNVRRGTPGFAVTVAKSWVGTCSMLLAVRYKQCTAPSHCWWLNRENVVTPLASFREKLFLFKRKQKLGTSADQYVA